MTRGAHTRMVGDPLHMYGQHEGGRIYGNGAMREIALYSQAMMLKSGQGLRDVTDLEARFDGGDRVVWGRWVEEEVSREVTSGRGKARVIIDKVSRFVEAHVYVLPSHQLTAGRRLAALPPPEVEIENDDPTAPEDG